MLRFYKYISAKYWFEALSTGEFKVSKPSELNDPFDCVGYVRGHFGKEAQKTFGTRRRLQSAIRSKAMFDSCCRVFCLTNCFIRNDNSEVLFWSHYASGGTGVRITLGLGPRDVIGLMGAVDYGMELPFLDLEEFERDPENTKRRFILNCLWRKGLAWAYEQEVRCVFDHDFGERIQIAPHLIKEITFGPCADLREARRLAIKLLCRYGTTDMFKCVRMNPTKYRYDERPLFENQTITINVNLPYGENRK